MEIWKDVVGYEGLYQVSSEGRVKSLERQVKKWDGYRTLPECILKPRAGKNGYQYINLWKEGKMKTMKVHRLVANEFIPNPENLPMVNHKDENKENNSVDNLEFCDATYNINYGTSNERRAEKLSKPVQQFTVDGTFVREWLSAREAERNGFHQSAVSACCRGKLKRHKGFIWQYA